VCGLKEELQQLRSEDPVVHALTLVTSGATISEEWQGQEAWLYGTAASELAGEKLRLAGAAAQEQQLRRKVAAAEAALGDRDAWIQQQQRVWEAGRVELDAVKAELATLIFRSSTREAECVNQGGWSSASPSDVTTLDSTLRPEHLRAVQKSIDRNKEFGAETIGSESMDDANTSVVCTTDDCLLENAMKPHLLQKQLQVLGEMLLRSWIS
jgi:hypothetical protein